MKWLNSTKVQKTGSACITGHRVTCSVFQVYVSECFETCTTPQSSAAVCCKSCSSLCLCYQYAFLCCVWSVTPHLFVVPVVVELGFPLERYNGRHRQAEHSASSSPCSSIFSNLSAEILYNGVRVQVLKRNAFYAYCWALLRLLCDAVWEDVE